MFSEEKVNKLVAEICTQIIEQYGKNPLENNDYGKIINEKHFKRICNLIDAEKVVTGGVFDKEKLRLLLSAAITIRRSALPLAAA